MFNIHMLCAGHGDCLWVEYGDAESLKRILIDAGTPATYESTLRPKIEAIIGREGKCVIELFVVTHIDEDHIGGALRFLDELDKRVKIKEIWFNGFFHLSNETHGVLGEKQGEQLTELIIRGGWPWNVRFDQRAVMVPDDGPLPSRTVAGMKLTLLSPTFARLQKLKPKWEKVIRAAGLVPGFAFKEAETVLPDGFLGDDIEALASTKFKQDTAPANGTSIAFIAEYEGVRALFGADAFPSVLLESLERKPFNGKHQKLNAFKLPHHASKNNVSTEMLEAFPADHYLVSTNGDKFEHPDCEALARVVLCGNGKKKKLHFNYRTDFNGEWASASRKAKWKYSAVFARGKQGLQIKL